MLRWTDSGAVTWPQTLQIRISKRYDQRIKANAPEPTRRMSLAEIQDNLQYFRHKLDTPRTKPCSSITLSGLQEESMESIEALKVVLGLFDFSYIRAHLDTQSIHLASHLEFVDHISITLHDSIILPPHADLYAKVQYSIALSSQNLVVLSEMIASLQAIYAFPITLMYPFPLRTDIIHNAPSIQDVQKAVQHIDPNIPIVGIPKCLSLRSLSKKTSNRWYIDADHQKDQALLFFPDLLRYYKSDECRFCSMATKCNGFFSQYLNQSTQLSPLP